MQSNMRVKTWFVANPGSHFCLCIVGIAKIIRACVDIGYCDYCIRSVTTAQEICHSAGEAIALRDSAVVWHGIKLWHTSRQPGREELTQDGEERFFGPTLNENCNLYAQGTKSLRSSPLRGARGERPVAS